MFTAAGCWQAEQREVNSAGSPAVIFDGNVLERTSEGEIIITGR